MHILRAGRRKDEDFSRDPKFVEAMKNDPIRSRFTRRAPRTSSIRSARRPRPLKRYDGHFHDLLNDLQEEVVMADITEWISTRLAVH